MRIRRQRWNVRLSDGGIVEGLTRRQARRLVDAWRGPIVGPEASPNPDPTELPAPGRDRVAQPSSAETDSAARPPRTVVTLVGGADPTRSASAPPTSLTVRGHVPEDLRRAFRRAIDDPGLLQVPRPLTDTGDRRPDRQVTMTILARQVPLAA